MLYGDLFTLQPTGIRFGPDALLPIGIFARSQCWGVWVPDASPTNPDPTPHLVISPIHPRFWPYLLRFEIKLAERPRSMAVAAQYLVDSDLNIQYGESSPSGHHHATWNVVCEAVDVRRQFEAEILDLQKRRGSPTNIDEIVVLATRLAEAMYKKAADLKERMLVRRDFLHERFLEPRRYLLHNPTGFTDKTAQKLAADDLPQSVSVRWIQNLPVFALYGTDAIEPYPLTFDPDSSMLRPRAAMSFSDILAAGGVTDVPTKAIASINPEEYHVRLLPFASRAEARRLVQINVEYDAHFPKAPQLHAVPTDDTAIGIWSRVCERVKESKINLRRVTSTTRRRDPASEVGLITLIGVKATSTSDDDINDMTADIGLLSESGSAHTRRLTVTTTASPLAVHKVFISWRSHSRRGKELREMAEVSARNWGFDPEWVEYPEGEDLARLVTAKLGECAALFQLLDLTDEERQRSTEAGWKGPALDWMMFEYGMGVGRKIPVMRMVDTSSMLQLSKWAEFLKVGGDYPGEFNISHGDQEVRSRIDRSMGQLAKRVRGFAESEF